MGLLDLPPRVVTRILLYLPFTSIVICQGVNRHLQALISGSPELQYYIHLKISGLIDNPLCDLPVSERLNRLLTRERYWEALDFNTNTIVDIPFRIQYFDTKLSPGIFYGVTTDEEFHHMQIPSILDLSVKWREVRAKQTIIPSGLCVHQHDLHVLVTTKPRTVYTSATGPSTGHEIQVHLNQLSTGEPHPDARRTVITFETEGNFGKPRVELGCAGDYLLMILTDVAPRNKPDEQVYVCEWKTGELKLRFSAPFDSYYYSLFLNTQVFLLPNKRTGELEYWRIPKNPSGITPHQPFFVLSLPRLRPNNAFLGLSCRAEPNPGVHSCDASKPFYTDSRHAIAIFIIRVQSSESAQPMTHFTLFIHRSSLLQCLERFSAFTSLDDRPTPIPYEEWGPPVCRWFNSDPTSWLATTFGQRYIAPPPRAATEWAPLTLFDFNYSGVAKALAAERRFAEARMLDEDGQSADYSPSSSRFRTKAVIQSLDPLDDPDHCFENTVYSYLPCTVRTSQGTHFFDGLLLDEENILGLRTDGEECLAEVQILYYR
ncbi:hypothetical protein P691DRAFT_271106 [Macrolepiota fuliginosa MF-IS2]|uniref:F-box domain-containing protein n=1 Tax=Macrolepiota fuliginosa MF-IS2 TaxID=1400762 RepID=A0A9P6C1I4_9AGAR|nr:hypothetical protein P691DRAFT_271106 [Macrolepiota fuliginosa MF-IS2]